jgi:hypothetical protein
VHRAIPLAVTSRSLHSHADVNVFVCIYVYRFIRIICVNVAVRAPQHNRTRQHETTKYVLEMQRVEHVALSLSYFVIRCMCHGITACD